MPGHIWSEQDRGPCVACRAVSGAPGRCSKRMGSYPNRKPVRAQKGKPDGWCGGGGLEGNGGASRPDGRW